MSDWQLIESIAPPNNVFDVLAKYWDAGLDKFLLRRITDCVQVDGEICTGSWDDKPVRLVDRGYRATHWMPIPEPPKCA